MLPALQAFEPSPVQQSVVTDQIGSLPEPSTQSIWDDPNAFANTAPQHNNVQQWAGNTWGHQQSPGIHGPTAPNNSRPKTKSAKKQGADLTEQESGLQASGIFLIAVPLITTLLPLFGVQLKRLAGLGNYAPLGGLFLGLIGSGIIVWARRKRSDSLVMGAIGAVCSTVFGIGGYSILEFMDSQPDIARVENNVITPPAAPEFPSNSGAAPTSSATYTVGNEGFVPTGPYAPVSPNSAFGGQPSPGTSPSSPPKISHEFEEASSPSSADEAMQRLITKEKDGDAFEQDPDLSSLLMTTYSQGERESSNLKFRPGGKMPELVNMVGIETQQSSLYDKTGVKGVCCFSFGSMVHMVPIAHVTQTMKAAVLAGDQEELYGLRFAFDGRRIVGFQGLVSTEGSSSPKETEWFGRKTDNVQESLNPKPGKTGFMCFQRSGEFVGFGWFMLYAPSDDFPSVANPS